MITEFVKFQKYLIKEGISVLKNFLLKMTDTKVTLKDPYVSANF